MSEARCLYDEYDASLGPSGPPGAAVWLVDSERGRPCAGVAKRSTELWGPSQGGFTIWDEDIAFYTGERLFLYSFEGLDGANGGIT